MRRTLRSRDCRRVFALGVVAFAGIFCTACETDIDDALLLPARDSETVDTTGLTLVARIFHISDTHIIDTLSPARFAEAHIITSSAWRPFEAYSTQIVDGILRTCNRIHASGKDISFVVVTGDTCDNSQTNELRTLLNIFDGQVVTPLSGPDDRVLEDKPDVLMDPYAEFKAQGLYREDVHGPSASIPWYTVFGNHDSFAVGIFPIFEDLFGNRTAPIPLNFRPGIFIPNLWDPTGFFAYGKISPARPGPPQLFELPQYVEPNPERHYFNSREYVEAMFGTITGPAGHGFGDPEGESWYSTSPLPGLRLIGLNTSDVPFRISGFLYMDGAVTQRQVDFLRAELDKAQAAGEMVIVASHHPSQTLQASYGSALVGSQFRELLNQYPNVILHLAGHMHRNRVADRGGYLEIETCSTLDLPQEARLVEIWRNEVKGKILITYGMFSHVDDALPALGDDPLRAMREKALSIAESDTSQPLFRPKVSDVAGDSVDARGAKRDREGVFIRK